jgi:hypothetical protein
MSKRTASEIHREARRARAELVRRGFQSMLRFLWNLVFARSDRSRAHRRAPR